ncbi:hypothetical protein [Qipengyuania algicida]|uniref:hypothetical protein n=1 Tax=Qipengyuania algicida TaxID=1836209 RepID=UPI001F1E990A|nr:hypothetical protein [Qipengyuania algicida]
MFNAIFEAAFPAIEHTKEGMDIGAFSAGLENGFAKRTGLGGTTASRHVQSFVEFRGLVCLGVHVGALDGLGRGLKGAAVQKKGGQLAALRICIDLAN